MKIGLILHVCIPKTFFFLPIFPNFTIIYRCKAYCCHNVRFEAVVSIIENYIPLVSVGYSCPHEQVYFDATCLNIYM